jgi:hypothetical protein
MRDEGSYGARRMMRVGSRGLIIITSAEALRHEGGACGSGIANLTPPSLCLGLPATREQQSVATPQAVRGWA